MFQTFDDSLYWYSVDAQTDGTFEWVVYFYSDEDVACGTCLTEVAAIARAEEVVRPLVNGVLN